MNMLREPLLHFLLVGATLFAAYDLLHRDRVDTDPRTIVVDKAALTRYAQFRARIFDANGSEAWFDRLSVQAVQRLADDYVREEALYREAKALGLDQNDYTARLRLVQQLEFITRGFADSRVTLTDDEVRRYFASHQDRYLRATRVTFTHVFFNAERHGSKKARALALEAVQALNAAHAPFAAAPSYGDRFLYHVNYVACEAEEIASHFGPAMQAQLFSLAANPTRWRGPFQSPYGFHVVLLTQYEPESLPPFDEVRAQVEREARQAAIEKRYRESIASIVKRYAVELKLSSNAPPK